MLGRRVVLALVSAAPLAFPCAAQAESDRWIVVLRDDAHSGEVALEHARAHGAEVSHVYRSALRGYAATIPAARLAGVVTDARVARVEPDGEITAEAQEVPYNISLVGADVSSTRAGDGTGTVSGVNVYLLDGGTNDTPDVFTAMHVSLAPGRSTACNARSTFPSEQDGDAHGTHVAGIAAAIDNDIGVVGVAPGAPITDIRVLRCNGRGRLRDLLAGIEWVTLNAVRPAVANLSLSGPASDVLDAAVRRSASSGIFYAVAAGNDGTDACTRSPARAGAGLNNGIVTVGATDAMDQAASFSNFGSCVDIFAPGTSVKSTGHLGGTTTMSGTSMASGHVAGGGALVLSGRPDLAPARVEETLTEAADATAAGPRLDVSGF